MLNKVLTVMLFFEPIRHTRKMACRGQLTRIFVLGLVEAMRRLTRNSKSGELVLILRQGKWLLT